jgi:MFS transporter, AAHS family, 4-hydroxybenzoate transporter
VTAGLPKADVAAVIENQERTWFGAKIFLLCCVVMLADGFDNQAINYAAPSIIAEWGINRALMTPVFNLSIAGAITGAVVFAMLADRYGRRPATMGAVALFGGFTLAIPLAHSIAQLALLRFCASLGVGGAMPLAMTLAADYARSGKRAFAATLLFAGYTAGSSGGGWLAAEIVPPFGWRSIFFIGGTGGLIIAAGLLIGLPESLKFLALRRRGDRRILVYARKLQPSANFCATTEFGVEQAAANGAPLKQLFAHRRSAMTVCLWFALGFAFATHFFLSQWLTTLLTPEIGFSSAARTQAVFQAGSALSFIFGYLIDRRGIPVTALAMFAAFAPVAAIGFAAHSVLLTMALALLSGILVLGGDVGISALPCVIYPPSIRSTATGAAFGVGRIGAILGPMFAGLLIWLNVPLTTIFVLGALPVLLSGAACVALEMARRKTCSLPVLIGVSEGARELESLARGPAFAP